jgi:hypothetical protein
VKHLRTIIATTLLTALAAGCSSRSDKEKETDATVSTTADAAAGDDAFLAGLDSATPAGPAPGAKPGAKTASTGAPAKASEPEVDALFGDAPPAKSETSPVTETLASADASAAAIAAPTTVTTEPITVAPPVAGKAKKKKHARVAQAAPSGSKRIVFTEGATAGLNPLHIAWTSEAAPNHLGLDCELKPHDGHRACVDDGVVVNLHEDESGGLGHRHLARIYLDAKGADAETRWHENLRRAGYLYAGTRTRKDGLQAKRFMSYDHSTHADLIWNEKEQAVTLKLFPTAKGLGKEELRSVASETESESK